MAVWTTCKGWWGIGIKQKGQNFYSRHPMVHADMIIGTWSHEQTNEHEATIPEAYGSYGPPPPRAGQEPVNPPCPDANSNVSTDMTNATDNVTNNVTNNATPRKLKHHGQQRGLAAHTKAGSATAPAATPCEERSRRLAAHIKAGAASPPNPADCTPGPKKMLVFDAYSPFMQPRADNRVLAAICKCTTMNGDPMAYQPTKKTAASGNKRQLAAHTASGSVTPAAKLCDERRRRLAAHLKAGGDASSLATPCGERRRRRLAAHLKANGDPVDPVVLDPCGWDEFVENFENELKGGGCDADGNVCEKRRRQLAAHTKAGGASSLATPCGPTDDTPKKKQADGYRRRRRLLREGEEDETDEGEDDGEDEEEADEDKARHDGHGGQGNGKDEHRRLAAHVKAKTPPKFSNDDIIPNGPTEDADKFGFENSDDGSPGSDATLLGIGSEGAGGYWFQFTRRAINASNPDPCDNPIAPDLGFIPIISAHECTQSDFTLQVTYREQTRVVQVCGVN